MLGFGKLSQSVCKRLKLLFHGPIVYADKSKIVFVAEEAIDKKGFANAPSSAHDHKLRTSAQKTFIKTCSLCLNQRSGEMIHSYLILCKITK